MVKAFVKHLELKVGEMEPHVITVICFKWEVKAEVILVSCGCVRFSGFTFKILKDLIIQMEQ